LTLPEGKETYVALLDDVHEDVHDDAMRMHMRMHLLHNMMKKISRMKKNFPKQSLLITLLINV